MFYCWPGPLPKGLYDRELDQNPDPHPPRGCPSNSLGPVWANMYSDPFSFFLSLVLKTQPHHWTNLSHFLFVLFEATTQLARQVHQERTQVVCSNKVDWSRLALGTPAISIILIFCFVIVVLE